MKASEINDQLEQYGWSAVVSKRLIKYTYKADARKRQISLNSQWDAGPEDWRNEWGMHAIAYVIEQARKRAAVNQTF